MFKSLSSVSFALLLLFSVVPSAFAGSSSWCDVDPVVIITTPAGNVVPIYNTNGVLGIEHQPMVLLAKVRYTVQSTTDHQGTVVSMKVQIPNDSFASAYPTRTTISTGPWGTLKVLGISYGQSGADMDVQFTLNVP